MFGGRCVAFETRRPRVKKVIGEKDGAANSFIPPVPCGLCLVARLSLVSFGSFDIFLRW